jgi:hypothetical protein
MIIALAGRRIDAPGAKAIRFPLSKVGEVKEKLKALFISIKPKALVCSAACGADLLALQVAGELGIQRSIVIPFDEQLFKSTSVTDRPGDWGVLYDTTCVAAATEEGIEVLDYPQNEDETYRRTNIDILEKAKALAEKYGSGDLTAVIVWDGKSREEGDITDHFRKEAKARGFTIHEVFTLSNQ